MVKNISKIILFSIYCLFLYLTLPIWNVLWQELKWYYCKIGNLYDWICLNVNWYDFGYVIYKHTSISDLLFVLPFWIIIWYLWFFIISKCTNFKNIVTVCILIFSLFVFIFISLFLWYLVDDQSMFKYRNDYIYELKHIFYIGKFN
jgi:hypothetical protein